MTGVRVLGRFTGRPARIAATTLALALIAFAIEDIWLVKFSVWLIFGILTLSLAFIWGHGGIFSFGQNAFFGVAGYFYGIIAINLVPETGETLTALVGAAVGGALLALLLGYFMFYGRLGDVYVAIITLAVTLVLFTVMAGTAGPQYRVGNAHIGGYNGMTGIPPIVLGVPGLGDGVTLTPQAMYVFVALLSVATYTVLSVLRRRPFGRIVAAIRENELRTELLGYDVRRYKLWTFVLGGVVAGLAGGLFAAWGQFINPAVFSLGQAALVVIWLLVGGQRSLMGAFVGAAIVEGISSTLAGGLGGDATPIILGGILIIVVLLFPDGLAGLARWIMERMREGRAGGRRPIVREARAAARETEVPVPDAASEVGVDGPILIANDVKKSFGGIRALQGVTLGFAPRGTFCLIGPNGAGKSTFFNLLVGRFRPSGGAIYFEGRDITRLLPYQRARLGIGIKLQVPSLYPGLSAWENVWLASYARTSDEERAAQRTEHILDWIALAGSSVEPAGQLSHGEQQWLEIGMVLAASPRVILLDEPSAGMTRDETLRTADIVRRLGERASVVVVEHDMEFVRHLGAPVTVFHRGELLAEGSLEEIRRDSRVLDVYLGRDGRVAVE